jgi:4-hydroxy-tetrahydrodipicolinate reductase
MVRGGLDPSASTPIASAHFRCPMRTPVALAPHSPFCYTARTCPGGGLRRDVASLLQKAMMPMAPIRVLVSGAAGRMGQFVVNAVQSAPDMQVVAAVDPAGIGKRLTDICDACDPDLVIGGHLSAAIEDHQPQVMVDFTRPEVVMGNIETALNHKVACVVGTTGFSETDIKVVARMTEKKGAPAIIASNFSIGAVLMMRFAALASRSFEYADIIERHHDGKADAPSGTALSTAQMMLAARDGEAFANVPTPVDKLAGSRGGCKGNIQIHSVRMKGYVADQDVIFGGLGETFTISHRTTSRECFMPGVLLAVRSVLGLEGLTTGIDELL